MENITLEKKNVFVSYCHKDVTEEWIDKLATSLGQYGINCIVDIYDLQLGQDLNYFMEQIKRVDKVLILLGKEYKERANDRKAGVGTETQIISNDVYNDVEQTKFIPIVVNKDENGVAYLPYYLEARLYTDFSDDSLFAKNIDELARQIHKLPKRVKPIVTEPPQFLIRKSEFSLLIRDDMTFDDLIPIVLKEMENIKCSYDEFKSEEDEAIIRKIEESKELRDYIIKRFWKAIDDQSVTSEKMVLFLERAYCVADTYMDSRYYEQQNDGCRFFLHEIIIYIIAILYKKQKFVMIRQLIKTTYFPDTSYAREGIRLESFYFYLKSLEYRNTRLNLRRRSVHADLLMQRANIKDVDINFDDIRLADNLILILLEWFSKIDSGYIYWYPVTIVYATFGQDDCLQLRKYLVSKSRFEMVRELFEVKNEADFLKRYNELLGILKEENRRSGRYTIPSICSIVKSDELFSRD